MIISGCWWRCMWTSGIHGRTRLSPLYRQDQRCCHRCCATSHQVGV